MRFTRFTDLSIRVLIYLSYAPTPNHMVTVSELSYRFNWSRHHVVKVVNFMNRQGWIVASRGRGGGVRLREHPSHYLLGNLLRTLEGDRAVNQCNNPPCELLPACVFNNIAQQAINVFYEYLNQYTLASVACTTEMRNLVKSMHERPFDLAAFMESEAKRMAESRQKRTTVIRRRADDDRTPVAHFDDLPEDRFNVLRIVPVDEFLDKKK